MCTIVYEYMLKRPACQSGFLQIPEDYYAQADRLRRVSRSRRIARSKSLIAQRSSSVYTVIIPDESLAEALKRADGGLFLRRRVLSCAPQHSERWDDMGCTSEIRMWDRGRCGTGDGSPSHDEKPN